MNDRLEIHTLGNLAIYRGGTPVTGLASRKAEAALVYLAANPRPHPREVLAEMLWDERSQSQSLANLRVVLSSLRKELGDIVVITRDTVALNPEAEVWLDARELDTKLDPLLQHRGDPPLDILESTAQAVTLYQGEFLEGVYLRECRALEEWIVREREHLHHKVVSALGTLVRHALQSGAYQTGVEHCRRLLALDPLMEAGHRWMMHLLALSGQRGAAITQYETCQHILWEELGVEPEAETTALYEQIMAGELSAAGQVHPVHPPELPDFMDPDIEETPLPPLVAREAELDRLEEILEQALSGKGQMAFIAGEAGSGKTALLRGFARQVQAKHPEALLALGECNAFSGQGDPYLPFRDLLQMLTGDVQSRLSAQTISKEQARRLWSALPLTVPALLEHGRDLLDTFVPAKELARRLRLAAPLGSGWESWIAELEGWTRPTPEALERTQLFEQFSIVLEAIARHAPLVLVLDDLQWADAGSIGLLFHLARRLEGSPIMILVAYRTEEIHADREGKRSPLAQALGEFKRQFGEVWIDLDASRQRQGRQLIDNLLDTEPNQLTHAFRQALFQRTGGHPLFTVELLRVMQERGSLVQDEHGAWCEGPRLRWDVLPARVEGAIEARLARLEAGNLDILRVACLMGEVFSLHVLARVTGQTEQSLARRLGEELGKRRQLVRELGPVQIGSQRDYRFHFQHVLFQQHLYLQVGEAERQLLHSEIGNILENQYVGCTEEITIELARHFSAAGEAKKASDYLLRAGDQARLLYAHQEAIDYYQRALAFLKEQGESERAARTLMKLGLTYHTAFEFQRARGAYEEGFALWQRASTSPPVALSPAPHALRINGNEPTTLDPTLESGTMAMSIQRQLFSGLIALGPEMEILPDVAASWEVTDGGRMYTFRLRDDVVWSDGRPVTSGDFEFAWKRVLDPATRPAKAAFLYDIKGARSFHQGQILDPEQVGVWGLDDHTLVVELEEPTGYFLYLLSHTSTSPVPRHILKSHGERWTDIQNLVTNGPFTLEAWQHGSSLSLEHNPRYHGGYAGNAQRVEISISLDREFSDHIEAYEKDELDLLQLAPAVASAAEFNIVRQRHANDYLSAALLNSTAIRFNVLRPPFDDRRVRRAFAMAIDRVWWADEVEEGIESPGTGGFVPPGMPGHSPEIGLAHDPERARQLLAEAGYPGGNGFPPTSFPLPRGDYISGGLQLQQRWETVLGVKVACEMIEWDAYFDLFQSDPKQHPQLYFMGWLADYPDPDNFLRVALGDLFQNEAYIQLLDQAKRTTDQELRMELYRQADRMLVEEAVVLPLHYSKSHTLVKPWVKKFPLSPLGNWSWKDVVIEPH